MCSRHQRPSKPNSTSAHGDSLKAVFLTTVGNCARRIASTSSIVTLGPLAMQATVAPGHSGRGAARIDARRREKSDIPDPALIVGKNCLDVVNDAQRRC